MSKIIIGIDPGIKSVIADHDALNMTKLAPEVLEAGIPACDEIPERLVPFGSNPQGGAWCHFFLDDYRFERLWNQPVRYIATLKKFAGTFSPDFSLFVDDPEPVQRWNHYRNQWLAAYWHHNGIKVIPTVGWSDEASFDWCFNGWPVGGVVAIGSVGTQKNTAAKVRFMAGYREMLTRLQPSAVLVYGTPTDLPGPVKWHDPFYSRFERR